MNLFLYGALSSKKLDKTEISDIIIFAKGGACACKLRVSVEPLRPV